MPQRVRLDTLVVQRGLADTRSRARALVLAGQVAVNGIPVSKAGTPTAVDASVTLVTPDHPYVGRGGIKLAHALDVFGVTVAGCEGLDIGASTGGFTDALLQGGARRVVALDVGHGQLAWRLRQDPRVVVLEGINARRLVPSMLPPDARRFDVVTVDVSFISLTLIVGRLPPLLKEHADVILLVKPQFEAERREVGSRGVVSDPLVRERVVATVTAAANAVGLKRMAATPSPIAGAEGNQEVFLHVRP